MVEIMKCMFSETQLAQLSDVEFFEILRDIEHVQEYEHEGMKSGDIAWQLRRAQESNERLMMWRADQESCASEAQVYK